MNYFCMQAEGVTIAERLDNIKDNIEIIVAFRPATENEILEEISNKLTDIILELRKKEGGKCL